MKTLTRPRRATFNTALAVLIAGEVRDTIYRAQRDLSMPTNLATVPTFSLLRYVADNLATRGYVPMELELETARKVLEMQAADREGK